VGYSTAPGSNRKKAVRWKRNPGTNTFNVLDLEVHPSRGPTDIFLVEAYGVNQDGTVIVGFSYYITSRGRIHRYESFIWRENESPKVQILHDLTPGFSWTKAYDVITKADGTCISAGSSTIATPVWPGPQKAVRWNNLSVEDLHFTL